MPAAGRMAIVTPVYNDWESFRELLQRLDAMAATQRGVVFDVIAVDDGSTVPLSDTFLAGAGLAYLGGVDVLHLASNLGHQRAIAIGLTTVDARARHAAAIVMDSDGEDRPEAVPALLAALHEDSGRIVVARRARRTEGFVFRVFYALYRLFFRLLTGRPIAFGNFCVLPARCVSRLVSMPEIWNNLAAAITRSRMPITASPANRGSRYAGESRMSMVDLLVHGLSAVSVHSDVVFARILVFSFALAGLTVCGIAAVVGIRFFTDLAIPGWATYTVAALFIVLLQTLMLSLGSVFLLLSNRSTMSPPPRGVAAEYVTATTTLRPA
jgi:glycosyltransferase involved in cell wall biosynthesis